MQDSDIYIGIIITTLVILLLIAGVFITMILANRRHVQQEIKMAQREAEYEKELRNAENEVQEQVLSNVARELHDNIGQLLTMIRLQIEQEKLDDEHIAERFAPAEQTLNDTIEQVRLLSHNLNTEYLETHGLIYATEKEVNRISALKRMQVHWEYSGAEPDIDKSRRIMIFRMLQEILNNALKHSRAKNIRITLDSTQGFVLKVEDDGRGFSLPDVQSSSKGSGLRNLVKRSKLAGLQLDIDSSPGKGSIFTFSET